MVCKNKPIIKASRYLTTRMHVINLHNLLRNQLVAHINLQQFTSIKRMKFLYGTLGYLALSTLVWAIHTGYLNLLPDLIVHNVSKLGPSDITILGHLNTKRKNIQSTKHKPIVDE